MKKCPTMCIFQDIIFYIFPKRLIVYLIEIMCILTFVFFVSTKCWAIDFKITAKKNQECFQTKEKKEIRKNYYLINT